MAANKDLRFQTSTPTTPDASVARYFTDTSGRLRFVDPNGSVFDANTYYRSPVANSAVSITSGQFQNADSRVTGYFYGTTGTKITATVLGEPNRWILAVGPSGESYAIPAYSRS